MASSITSIMSFFGNSYSSTSTSISGNNGEDNYFLNQNKQNSNNTNSNSNSLLSLFGDDLTNFQYTPNSGNGPLEDPNFLAEMSYSTQLMQIASTQMSQLDTQLGVNPNTGKNYNLLDPYDQVDFMANDFNNFVASIDKKFNKVIKKKPTVYVW